jgi:hypothetical protein
MNGRFGRVELLPVAESFWPAPEKMCHSWLEDLDSCLRRNDRVGIRVHPHSSAVSMPRYPLEFQGRPIYSLAN